MVLGIISTYLHVDQRTYVLNIFYDNIEGAFAGLEGSEEVVHLTGTVEGHSGGRKAEGQQFLPQCAW